MNGKRLKNHATIKVDEDIITWETSYDKCTFYRTLVPLPADATSPPCSKCANPWNSNKSTTNSKASDSSITNKLEISDTVTNTSVTTQTTKASALSTATICSQSLNGTPYVVKKRPLIITKPASRQVTQTSTCHQLITTARPVEKTTSKRIITNAKSGSHGSGLFRASSTPNLKKVGVQGKSSHKKSKGEWASVPDKLPLARVDSKKILNRLRPSVLCWSKEGLVVYQDGPTEFLLTTSLL